MKKSIMWMLCLTQVVLAGSNVPETRKNQVVIETNTTQLLPDSAQTLLQEVEAPVGVDQKQQKDKKAIVLTALRIVLSVVLIVLLVVLIAILV